MVRDVDDLGKAVNINHFRVTIFGSARIKEGDPIYNLIYKLSKKIAEEGIDIVTGGGPGLMDAATRGHHSGKPRKSVHALGLTIKLPREQKRSIYLDIAKDFNKFSHRLDNFMKLSNVIVVAPGGVGTTLEFLYSWQLVQVKQICNIPIILLGEMWSEYMEWVKKWQLNRKFLSKEDFGLVFIAKNATEVMDIIKATKKDFETGVNICTNLKKYR